MFSAYLLYRHLYFHKKYPLARLRNQYISNISEHVRFYSNLSTKTTQFRALFVGSNDRNYETVCEKFMLATMYYHITHPNEIQYLKIDYDMVIDRIKVSIKTRHGSSFTFYTIEILREYMFRIAIKYDCLPVLKYILQKFISNYHAINSDDLIIVAINNNKKHIAQWLMHRVKPYDNNNTNYVLQVDNVKLDLLGWFCKHGYACDNLTPKYMNNGVTITSLHGQILYRVMNRKKDCIEMLKKCKKYGIPLDADKNLALDRAFHLSFRDHGKIDNTVIKFLLKNIKLTPEVIRTVILYKRIELVEYLLFLGVQPEDIVKETDEFQRCLMRLLKK